MQLIYLLPLPLFSGLVAAKALPVRRDILCSYSAAPNTGDTCDTFVIGWGLTVDRFKEINPDAQCPNLDVKKSYCVIGTITEPTEPTEPTTITTTTTQRPTTTSTTTTSPAGPSPTMPGLPENCDRFHKIISGDQCGLIETKYGISDSKFKQWNPEINGDCTNLWLDYYVCVHTTTTSPGNPTPTTTQPSGPSPTMPGLPAKCDKFHKVVSGDQCGLIESKYGISDSQFKQWNPEINAGCTNLWLDYYICVHVSGAATTSPGNPQPTATGPTPQMPGIVSNCKKFHLVVSGDYCYAIQQKYGITLAKFLSWNTAVNDTYSNLWAAYYVYVGV